MATAGIMAVCPLSGAGLIQGPVQVDARTGSSGSGVSAGGSANLHAERSGAMRVFAPTRHRHEAEIAQATGLPVRMTATGVEAVRGVQVLCRAQLVDGAGEADVRRAYREAYADEPFVRVVAHRRGAYRLPEPKILAGSNFCDVGFAVSAETGHVVLIGALDNLVKGGAGNAVQCLNVRYGWPERTGLDFPGLHPN
jgi:N-acetyl-gamma-glutamyl-phosphate/LysW-gamma-L-alpha-aminoadipyl-6-phosphate reductase